MRPKRYWHTDRYAAEKDWIYPKYKCRRRTLLNRVVLRVVGRECFDRYRAYERYRNYIRFEIIMLRKNKICL